MWTDEKPTKHALYEWSRQNRWCYVIMCKSLLYIIKTAVIVWARMNTENGYPCFFFFSSAVPQQQKYGKKSVKAKKKKKESKCDMKHFRFAYNAHTHIECAWKRSVRTIRTLNNKTIYRPSSTMCCSRAHKNLYEKWRAKKSE